MRKRLIYCLSGLLAISLVFLTACADSGKEAESIITPEPPPIVTPAPEPTPEPEQDWEEPPVPTIYNPEADLNNDGHVDKAEWESWVAAHPEDTNQDLIISEDEKAPAKPSGGETSGKPSGGDTKPSHDTQSQGNRPQPSQSQTNTQENPSDPYANDPILTQEDIDQANKGVGDTSGGSDYSFGGLEDFIPIN